MWFLSCPQGLSQHHYPEAYEMSDQPVWDPTYAASDQRTHFAAKGCARLCPAQKDPLGAPVAACARELWNSLVKAQLKPQLRSNILSGQGATIQSAAYELDKSPLYGAVSSK